MLLFKKQVNHSKTAVELKQLLLTKNSYLTLEQWAKNTNCKAALEISSDLNRYCYNNVVISDKLFKDIKILILLIVLSMSFVHAFNSPVFFIFYGVLLLPYNSSKNTIFKQNFNKMSISKNNSKHIGTSK